MAFELKIPQIGESITEGYLAEWQVKSGDTVSAEDEVLVLETDKITMAVAAERSGKIEILVEAGETVEVGQVVAKIDESASAEDQQKEEPAEEESDASSSDAEQDQTSTTTREDTDLDDQSPAVRKMLAESHLDPADIEGSGKDGRILKADVLRHLENKDEAQKEEPRRDAEPEEQGQKDSTESHQESPTAKSETDRDAQERQSREPMSRFRRRVAERLVEVQQTAAILTTFNEVDMSRVIELRRLYKADFEKRHGVGLGFMSFFVKATVDALKTVPEVNAFIDGADIVTNHYYDIGIAVSSEKGLVVPVIRDADTASMARIETDIKTLADKAQKRTLGLDDLSGGVFTISNGGIFGSVLSTPILNPPQSAILGMHAIKKRAVVVDDEIVIRPMMNLALSYDHRLIDGREAVTFLKRIVECIENPDRLLLEV